MLPAERPCNETIRLTLNRVLDSKGFQRSDRLRAFLAYVVRKEMTGEGAQLKGYSIAVDVFGRCQTFDADSDPLVRVHAGKLRKLLKAYYETDGLDEEWQIVVPKGTYVPEYRRGRAALPAAPVQSEVPSPLRRRSRPSWRPAPSSSPLAVLTVLPLLLFAPLPSPEMMLDIEAEAKLVQGPLVSVRGLPSVRVSIDGPQDRSVRRFAEMLGAAALRYETLGEVEVVHSGQYSSAANQALAFAVFVAWHDAPEPGMRITLRHDGEDIPIRQEFVAARRLASESDMLFESTSLAAKLFALDGEIYAHTAVEGLRSTLMECVVATAHYKKLLTRKSFQQAWECQQRLGPLKGDEPFFILSANDANSPYGH